MDVASRGAGWQLRSRSLVDEHPDGVFEFDLDGVFVAGNRALELLTGYSREELVGTSFGPLVHPADLARVRDEFETATRGISRTYDMVALRKDGTSVAASVTNIPIVVDGEVVGVYGVARDISEQQATTAALAASEAELRGMFASAATGISVTTPTGTFVRANGAYCAMLGYTEHELLQLNIQQVLHPDDREANNASVAELLAGRRRRFVSEKRYLAKDGTPVWVRASVAVVRDAEGAPVHLVANAEDVTERMSAQAELARSQSLTQIAGRVARVGGWTHDPESGETFWSNEVLAITGAAHGRPLTMTELFEQFAPASQQKLLAAGAACAATGTAYDLELEYVTFDGRPIWLRCVGEAERDADGVIVRLHGTLQDITTQRQAAQEIEQLAGRLTTTMESITDALFALDDQWQFTYVNTHAERLLQRTRTSLLGRNIWEEFPDAVGTRLYDIYHRAVAEQTTMTVDDYHYEPLELWIEARAYPSANGLTIYFRDISEQRAAAAERDALLDAERHAREEAQLAQNTIAHQATHDPLTGLYNRNAITTRLEMADPAGYTVLLLDLDGFRQVNDGLGQTAGNQLLMNVARLLQDLVRRNDVVARAGGDEFVVLLPGHDPQTANRIAEQILERLRTPMQIAGRRLYVTTSIGISRAYPTASGEAAMRDADVALYQAKDAGRNCSVWYDPDLQQQVAQRLTTAAELHDALETDQLVLHYQPAFELATGRLIGAEALVRWQHPEAGLISPGVFIPVAEETGLIEPMGEWCLATAVDTACAWNRVDESFTVWVNVAVHQLRRPGLATNIRQLLDSSGTRPHQLGIEITESALANDPAIVLAELDAISALGVKIAIDDFGTGYSSLSRLAQLPIDLLKIDRSFINVLDTPAGAATVAAIIDLAHATALEVIAEGVETPEQLAILRDAGCDHVSGFLLARPDRAEQLSTASAAGSQIIQDLPPAPEHVGSSVGHHRGAS